MKQGYLKQCSCLWRGSPWFFFQTAEDPGGEEDTVPEAWRMASEDLLCVWSWVWLSEGSGAAFGDADWLEASFLSWDWGAVSLSCSGTSWGEEISGRGKMGGPSTGGSAEPRWWTAAGGAPSGFATWKGASWAEDIDSSCGGTCSTVLVLMLVPLTADDRGLVSSAAFVLPRGTLEQVCRCPRRLR